MTSCISRNTKLWSGSALVIKHLTFSSLVVAAVFAPLVALAGVTKCTGSDGKVTFSDQPCTGGQTATTTQAPAKAAASASKPSSTAGASKDKENTGAPGSNLQRLDSSCKEERDRLFLAVGTKTPSAAGNENLASLKAKYEARCDSSARFLANASDLDAQALKCKTLRDELKELKSKPVLTSSSSSTWEADVSIKEGNINRTCPPAKQ